MSLEWAASEPDGLLPRLMRGEWQLPRGILEATDPVVRAVVENPVASGAGGLSLAAAGRAFLLWRERTMTAGGRWVSVLAPPEVDEQGAAALWDNLHELMRSRWAGVLRGQPHLSFEYHWSVDGLEIGIWAPRCVPAQLVEQAVEAAWPSARTTTSPAASPLPTGPGQLALGGELALGQSYWFPLRAEHAADPLRAVIGAVGGLGSAERASVQVLARPAGGRVTRRLRRAARRIRVGAGHGAVPQLLDLISPASPGRPRTTQDPTVSPDVRAVLAKAESPLWTGLVRYAVSGPGSSRSARRRLRGRAHALASSFGLWAGRNRLARRRLRRLGLLTRRILRRGYVLSTAELASLAHLPVDANVVGLARAGARRVPPPPGVHRAGPQVKVLGDADAGPARTIGMMPADARYHAHVMGTTGSGKSTLLTNLVLQDREAGRGVVVIDPKGDLVTDIHARLSPRQRREAILLDPGTLGDPPTLNMLEVPEGVDADLVVEHLVGIFRRIFQQHWGPRTDDVLRSACLTLLRHPDATLSQVPALLADSSYRAQFLRGLDDNPALGGFWAWYSAQSEAQRSQVIGPVLNKLRAFLLRSFVRKVVDAPHSSIDMHQVLDGGLLLVRVPKGVLGEDTARLLGSFVVAKVWQAATGRIGDVEGARADASLVVDEFQNFLTLPRSFDEMLAEARGYRLALVLAHQHLGQLSREVRDALSTNARNKLIFTCSPEDARTLQPHFLPDLTDHDLAHLARYQVAAKLVVDGQDQRAFTFHSRPSRPAHAEQARDA